MVLAPGIEIPYCGIVCVSVGGNFPLRDRKAAHDRTRGHLDTSLRSAVQLFENGNKYKTLRKVGFRCTARPAFIAKYIQCPANGVARFQPL